MTPRRVHKSAAKSGRAFDAWCESVSERAALLRFPWERGPPIVCARAPGRLDVMGGIADYSGSLVLELPLADSVHVAVQRSEEPTLRVMSTGGAGHRAERFETPIAELFVATGGGAREPLPYEAARALPRVDPRTSWAAYVTGAFLVLVHEKGRRVDAGARIFVDSTVAEGKGLASSAALEVALVQAVAAAFDVPLAPLEIAELAQKIEHAMVGSPCGLMDQLTAVFGRAGELLEILCQPADVRGGIAIPQGLAFFGVDSGLRRTLSASDYSTVRTGAFMGYRMLADFAGLRVESGRSPLAVVDPRWRGHLANVDAQEFDRDVAARLPERMIGAEFLARFGGITDPLTRVEPRRLYPVRAPTSHPVHEHARVHEFADLMRAAHVGDEERLRALGDLMYASHESYTSCGLGSAATDEVVERVRALGPERGLYGAKITGGGSGGTVAILARADAEPLVRELAEEHSRAREFLVVPHIYSGSSPGAATSGVVKRSTV